MSIREDSKKIVRYFLDKAIACGDLCLDDERFSYNDLAATLGLQNGEYCRVCFQYLVGHGYLDAPSRENSMDVLSSKRSVLLFYRAIDFLEEN